MSSIYAGADTYPASPVLPDDGDPASAAGIGRPALETAMDRTTWLRARMRDPKLVTFSSVGYVESSGGIFLRDFNFMDVYTTASGGTLRVQLPDLVHGASLDGVTVLFVPDNGHTGLPATNITIKVSRSSLAYNVTPAVPTVLGSATYTPVSLPDYVNGKVKALSITGLAHTVNATGYAYFLDIEDEDGVDSLDGNAYMAFTTNYT